MNYSLKDRIVLTVSIVVALAVLFGITYFFLYSQKNRQENDALISSIKNSLQATSTESEIRTSLSNAEADLKLQTSRFIALKSEFARQQAFLESMKSDFAAANSAVNKTDILFEDPETSAPEIKVVTKTPNLQKEINQRRLQVTKVLDSWKKEIDKIQIVGPNSDERAIVESNMSIVQSYLEELQDIVENLSVENSGLTQTVIDSYVSVVNDAVQSLNQIVTTLSSISDPGSAPVVYVGGSDNPNADSSTNSNSNQTVVVIPPVVVTPADVTAQQDAVDEAQNKVDDLQNILDQNQDEAPVEIPDTGGAVPPSSVQGIIVDQPGQPQLIPGTSRN